MREIKHIQHFFAKEFNRSVKISGYILHDTSIYEEIYNQTVNQILRNNFERQKQEKSFIVYKRYQTTAFFMLQMVTFNCIRQ